MCPIHCRTAGSPPKDCLCTDCNSTNHGIDRSRFMQDILLTRADCGGAPGPRLAPVVLAQIIAELPDWVGDESGTEAIQWLLAQGLADPEGGTGGGVGGSLETHIFCSAIVLLVRAVDAIDRALKTTAAATAKAMTQAAIRAFAADDPETPQKRLFVELAAIAASNAAPTLLGVDAFLTQVRIAAVIVCPNPNAHDDIMTYCVVPLAESHVATESLLAARKRFRELAEGRSST